MVIALLTAVYCSMLVFFLVTCFPRLKCWFYAFKKQERLENPINNRLAVLVPARNESKTVGTLLDCLCKQSYPKECFDVHVIVADENDPTVEMARAVGMTVHTASEQTCKSDALDSCLQTLLAEDAQKYEAYIIIDADCALDVNFLREMNNALASGADIICSKKVVKNYLYGTRRQCPLSACCNGLIWTLIDNMGNKYKSAKGYPCFTVGTGLMIRKNVILDKNGWPYKETLTEDVEFMHDAVLDHRKFFYYEYAVLYMEEAQKLSVTNKRRRRWLTGVVEAERLYRKRTSAECSAAERYYTSALNHVFGYIGVSVVFFAVMAVTAVVLAITSEPLWRLCAILAAVAVLTVYLSFLIMTAVAMLCEREHISLPLHRRLALLFVHPIFYMQYIFIIGRAIFFPQRKKKWEVIDRVDFSEAKK